MKKVELQNLKDLRTKNYKELLGYLNTHLPKNYNETQGNIKEVLQWGNIAKLIYIYLINEQIHNAKMNKNVSDLKNAHFEISKLNDNIADKIKDNIEYVDYEIDKRLLIRSIMDGVDYISVNRVANLIPNIVLNKKINKEHNSYKKNGLDIMEHMLDYIAGFSEVMQSEDFFESINRITPLPGVTVSKNINDRRKEHINKIDIRKEHVNKIVENKKQDDSCLTFLLNYFQSDVDFYKEIEANNRKAIEEKLNEKHGILKSKKFYKDMIKKETNPEIIKFINKYQKVK